MVFSSVVFLFGFLPVVLAGYYLLPHRWRNGWLFLSSLFFYGFGEPRYMLVMLASVTAAYLCGFPIGKYRESRPLLSRGWLTLSVCLNLSALLFFKYTNFFIENLAKIPPLAGVLSPIDGLSLPIGISFYTFQIISYSVDLYRGETETQRNFVAFGTYVALFPQLVAGPIVRYRDIDDQLTTRTHTAEKFAAGIHRFAVGFGKKALLGDSLSALYAYLGTVMAAEASVAGAWLSVLAYTLHIYFDFSGYSDMAVGLGRMFGFEFPENFHYPYTAHSVSDFWRRWHMTLTAWFRAYVYIPLGGNRCGRGRQAFNLAVVWLLTGFWHGASWNFLLWGLFYLLILLAEKFLFGIGNRPPRSPVARAAGSLWTLLAVGIGWMLFDHSDLSEAAGHIGAMFGIGTTAPTRTAALLGYECLRALPLLAVACLGATPYPARTLARLTDKHPRAACVRPVLTAAVLLLSVAYTINGGFSPFLYFNF